MAANSKVSALPRTRLGTMPQFLGKFRAVFIIQSVRVSAGALLLLSACGHSADLSKKADELDQAFPASHPNPLVSVAAAAVRSNDFAVSVIALENAQRQPGMTPNQLMAVQRTLQSITADLVARAARGDAAAQAQLAAIERSRSQ